jgi:hypothetical protein
MRTTLYGCKELFMTGFSAGPRLLVHILIIAMVNALCFPFFYRWSGSILYAFLISVGVLCAYGLVARRLLGRRKA